MTILKKPAVIDNHLRRGRGVMMKTVCTDDSYDKVLIFLHGVGGCGDEWSRFLKSIVPNNTKILLPTASRASVTMFQGKEMNSW